MIKKYVSPNQTTSVSQVLLAIIFTLLTCLPLYTQQEVTKQKQKKNHKTKSKSQVRRSTIRPIKKTTIHPQKLPKDAPYEPEEIIKYVKGQPHKTKKHSAKQKAKQHGKKKGTIKTKKIRGKIEVPIATSLPLKGEVSIIGKPILDGANLFFNKLKKEKRPYKHLVTLFSLNDNGRIPATRKNINTLYKKTPAFLNLYGSETILGLLKIIKKKQISIFFPLEGLDEFRTDKNDWLIYLRTSHEQEVKALIDYTINQLDRKKFAIFYEASDWGEGVRSSVKKILKNYNIKPLIEAYYQQHTVNVSKAANIISNSIPDAIFCIAQSRPGYNFICQVIDKGMHQSTFLGLSSLSLIQTTLHKAKGVELITSSVVPNPLKSSLEIAKQYRTDMKKYLPNRVISSLSFESYINAQLFLDALTACNTDISTHAIMQTLEATHQKNFKGLKLSFDPKTRTLSHTVWINLGEKKEWPFFEEEQTLIPSPANQGDSKL